MISCVSPPELDEKQLLAYLDGEANHQVAAHLARCPYCRERAEELAQLQNDLTARLYRLACPSPLELGDYYLGLLPAGQTASVVEHLQGCPHCAHEISLIKDYLAELTPPLEISPLDQVKVLIARLVNEKGEGRHPGEPVLKPAFAMLRGDAQGPVTLEADGILIILDMQPANEGQVTILGQIATDEQDRWTGASIELRQEGALQLTTNVDDIGAFLCEGISPGPGELKIIPKSGPVVLAKLEIVV